ncbi:MAG: hypothetical protein K0S26_1399, partial [Bacteroidota bacterium]|nr:hypothetical protein [Bacteroidota bacterium]
GLIFPYFDYSDLVTWTVTTVTLKKVKLLKFIDAVIVKFKFNEITSQSQFHKFQDNLTKYHDYADDYKDVYPDYAIGLIFPYFDYSDLVTWTVTTVTLKKVNGEVTETKNTVREKKSEDLGLSGCEFNIRNKLFNNIKDISSEEKIIANFLSSENIFKYYRISSPLNCLIEFYFSIADYDKVNDLFNILVNKVEPDDKHNIEKDFDYISNVANTAGNYEKGIEFAIRGINFLKTNFPNPKTKAMGSVYKTLGQMLFDNKEFERALSILNEALSYNENLSLKQLLAKTEKQLSK